MSTKTKKGNAVTILAVATVQPTMKLGWSKEPRTGNLPSFGIIAKLLGVGGSIRPSGVGNLTNADKRVSLILTKANGEWQQVVASEPVSRMIREKSISMTDIASFELVEGNSQLGEKFPLVVMPMGVGEGLKITDEIVKAQPKAINIDDLIAL
jgi:hypothetical protein